MAQISRRKLNPKVQEKIENLFEDFLKTIGKHPKASEVVADLFTPTEKVMLAKRITIAYLLYQNKSDIRNIADAIKVSTTTVAHINFILKNSGSGFRTILSRLEKTEKVKDLLSELAFYMISGSERQAAEKLVGKLKPPKRNRYLN